MPKKVKDLDFDYKKKKIYKIVLKRIILAL